MVKAELKSDALMAFRLPLGKVDSSTSCCSCIMSSSWLSSDLSAAPGRPTLPPILTWRTGAFVELTEDTLLFLRSLTDFVRPRDVS